MHPFEKHLEGKRKQKRIKEFFERFLGEFLNKSLRKTAGGMTGGSTDNIPAIIALQNYKDRRWKKNMLKKISAESTEFLLSYYRNRNSCKNTLSVKTTDKSPEKKIMQKRIISN